MAVRSSGYNYVSYGQWVTNDYGNFSVPGLKATLPAVIGVFER